MNLFIPLFIYLYLYLLNFVYVFLNLYLCLYIYSFIFICKLEFTMYFLLTNLYLGLEDAIQAGEVDPKKIGKRVFLSSNFTGIRISFKYVLRHYIYTYIHIYIYMYIYNSTYI